MGILPSGPWRSALDFGYQMAGRLLGSALLVVSLGLVVRYLGATDFGYLATATAFYSILLPVTDFGVNAVVLRRHAGGESLQSLTNASLGLSVAFIAPVTALAVLAGQLIYQGPNDERLRHGILLMSPVLVVTTLTTTYLAVFQANRRFGPIGAAEATSKLVYCAAVLAIVASEVPAPALYVAQGLMGLPGLVLLIAAATRHGRFRPTFNWNSLIILGKAATPIGITTAIWAIHGRVDIIILSLISSPADVGQYGVALRLTDALAAVAIVFSTTVFPILTAAFHAGTDRFQSLSRWATDGMVIVALPLTIGGAIIAPAVVRIVAGADFRPATPPLQILLVGLAFGFVNVILASQLIIAGEERFLMWLSVGTLGLNVGMNLVLIPSTGISGAAAATLATHIVSWAAGTRRLRQTVGVSLDVAVIVRTLCAAAAMCIGLWLMAGRPLVLQVLVGALGYILVLLVLRVPQAIQRSQEVCGES